MKLGKSESQFLAGKAWRGIKRSALTKRNGDSLAKPPGVTNQNTKYLFRMKDSKENSRFKVLLKVTL